MIAKQKGDILLRNVMQNVEAGSEKPLESNKSNKTLERESQGCTVILFYMFIFLMLDVWKQVTSYGMKYYNNNRYPLPQTQVVAVTECMKLTVFFVILIYTKEIKKVKLSPLYALPSVIYAINNNVYYFALNYVTPPIWNIIIQLRVVFTALTYRCIFRRQVSVLQWVALSLLIVSIVLTNLTGGNKMTGENNFSIAIGLSIIGSILSVLGTVYMEYLFKNDKRPFAEMQFQLYLYSGVIAWGFYTVEAHTTRQHNISSDGNISWTLVTIMVVGCIILSATSGITVAFIVKKLDNIVKLYSQALSNMLTSVACTILFPNHFHLSLPFILCLLVMFAAIFLYENQNLKLEKLGTFISSNQRHIPIVSVAVLLSIAVIVITTVMPWGISSLISEKLFT